MPPSHFRFEDCPKEISGRLIFPVQTLINSRPSASDHTIPCFSHHEAQAERTSSDAKSRELSQTSAASHRRDTTHFKKCKESISFLISFVCIAICLHLRIIRLDQYTPLTCLFLQLFVETIASKLAGIVSSIAGYIPTAYEADLRRIFRDHPTRQRARDGLLARFCVHHPRS